MVATVWAFAKLHRRAGHRDVWRDGAGRHSRVCGSRCGRRAAPGMWSGCLRAGKDIDVPVFNLGTLLQEGLRPVRPAQRHVDLDPHRRDVIASIGESVGGFLQAIVARKPTPPEKSIAFTIGMIALGAKMAKADGVVTEVEIAAFKQVFHIPDGELAAVARVFNLAKQDTAGFETYARQIARLFEPQHAMLEDVLDGLFHIAKADNAFHPGETRLPRPGGGDLRLHAPADFARIRARHVAVADDPYLILGLDRMTRRQTRSAAATANWCANTIRTATSPRACPRR